MVDTSRLWRLFDTWVLRILQGLLALGIVAALAIIALMVLQGIPSAFGEVGSVVELQRRVQGLFAGVLLVVLGLELMDTLREYFIEHRLRLEFLLSVALIAVARHVIQLDYEHSSPTFIAAVALLVLVLGVSYVAIRRYGHGTTPPAS